MRLSQVTWRCEHSRLRSVEWPTVALLVACYALWAVVTAFYSQLGAASPRPDRRAARHAALLAAARGAARPSDPLGGAQRGAGLPAARAALPLPPLQDAASSAPQRRGADRSLRRSGELLLRDRRLAPAAGLAAEGARLQQHLPRPLPDRPAGHARRLRRPRPAADRRTATAQIMRAWLHHAVGLALVLGWTSASAASRSGSTSSAPISALSILNLRTFAEHQAHEAPGGRTVIVEASPVFGLLFLNNNLHYVHHENPRVPWYKLPALYRAQPRGIPGGQRELQLQRLWRDDPALSLPPKDAGPASLPAARLTQLARRRAGGVACRCTTGRRSHGRTTRCGRRSPSGCAQPGSLRRRRSTGRAPHEAVWRDPGLVLSQTCGFPFSTRLRGMVRLVGTPIYDVRRLRGPVLFEHDRRRAATSPANGSAEFAGGASPTTAPTAFRATWRFARRCRRQASIRRPRVDRNRQPPRLGPRRRRGRRRHRRDRRRLLGACASLRAGGGVALKVIGRRRCGPACRSSPPSSGATTRFGQSAPRSRMRSPTRRRGGRDRRCSSPTSACSTSGTTARSPRSRAEPARRCGDWDTLRSQRWPRVGCHGDRAARRADSATAARIRSR